MFNADGEKRRSMSQLTISKKSCPWFFEFTVSTHERNYTLRASTKEQRKLWVRIFQLIIDMTKWGISTKEKNPFDFEDEREEKQKKMGSLDKLKKWCGSEPATAPMYKSQMFTISRHSAFGLIR
jgi:hypothetical protein